MSSATARAEARRKAILARGTDRLAKLTTSARGEDAPVLLPDDPPPLPLPNRPNLSEFVGETTTLPTPPSGSRRTSGSDPRRTTPPPSFQAAGLGDNVPDPSVWSEEQQRQLLSALMGGGPIPQPLPGQPGLPSAPTQATNGESVPTDDPFAALLASMIPQGQSGPGGPPIPPMFEKSQAPAKPPAPKTFIQKVMPLIHLLAAWILLAYFMLWKEPVVFEETSYGTLSSVGVWTRWAQLASKSPAQGFGVQLVPFFWAFTTLTIVLHSWRIYSGLDRARPPMLVSLALPHLPPPLPSLILNIMKYWQIGKIFLDDIAGVLVAMGLLIWIATWVAA